MYISGKIVISIPKKHLLQKSFSLIFIDRSWFNPVRPALFFSLHPNYQCFLSNRLLLYVTAYPASNLLIRTAITAWPLFNKKWAWFDRNDHAQHWILVSGRRIDSRSMKFSWSLSSLNIFRRSIPHDYNKMQEAGSIYSGYPRHDKNNIRPKILYVKLFSYLRLSPIPQRNQVLNWRLNPAA